LLFTATQKYYIFRLQTVVCPFPQNLRKALNGEDVAQHQSISKSKNSSQILAITANYTLKSDGHVKVDNRLHYGGINGSLQQAVGDAYAPDPSVPAKLAVTFGAPIEAPYWVLSTDYSSYALVFSCTNLVVYRFEYAWILSRTPIMDPALKQRLLARFRTFGVDTSAFVDTMQEGCKYY